MHPRLLVLVAFVLMYVPAPHVATLAHVTSDVAVATTLMYCVELHAVTPVHAYWLLPAWNVVPAHPQFTM